MKIDSRSEGKFDLQLLLAVFSLVGIGVAAIYSASSSIPEQSTNYIRQIVSFGIALVAFLVAFKIPFIYIEKAVLPVYIFAFVLLLLVLAIGKIAGGQKSWLVFGPLRFQPAEFAKFATVIALARYLSRTHISMTSFKDIIVALGIGFVPVILIMLEPDMGSSLVFGFIIIGMLFWRGLPLFLLFLTLSPGIVAVVSLLSDVLQVPLILAIIALLYFFRESYRGDIFTAVSIITINVAAAYMVDFAYDALSPHQQLRIQSFIDPMADPLGSGYNAIQAQIAVGSGGFFGKGFLQGNQTQLQFIPEQWTDFVFCGIAEEFGFVGSIIVVFLYTFISYRIIRIASSLRDSFMSLLVVGFWLIYFAHFIINLGMAIGVVPVIGIPLPFVSFGGSSLIVNLTMLGIIFNIAKLRVH